MKKLLLFIIALSAYSAISQIQAATVMETFTATTGNDITISGDITIGGGVVTAINLTYSSTGKGDATLTTVTVGGAATEGGGVVTLTGDQSWTDGDGSTFVFSTGGAGVLQINHREDGGDSSPNQRFDVANGATVTFTIVPEPHEYAMMAGLGLLGFGVWRRKSMKMV